MYVEDHEGSKPKVTLFSYNRNAQVTFLENPQLKLIRFQNYKSESEEIEFLPQTQIFCPYIF